jgi:hypothetical protein
LKIDIGKVPFSRRGAYLAISRDSMASGGGLWLRSLIRPEWGTGRKKVSDHLFRFLTATGEGVFTGNEPECLPWELILNTENGSARLHFSNGRTLAVSAEKTALVLEHDHDELAGLVENTTPQSFRIYFPVIRHRAEIDVTHGQMRYDGDSKRIFILPQGDRAEFTIKACRADLNREPDADAHSDVESIRRDYENFAGCYGPDGGHSELAAYILWSTEYAPKGNITRRSNAASKSLMNLVWSWDNCFNALGVEKADPGLAWSNLFLFFDLQCGDGMLPDAVNPAIVVDWYTKPPIHGFAARRLLEHGNTLPETEMERLYSGLARWTEWWYNQPAFDGLACYRHPFDSGWDNATCFDRGHTVITPDLNAYLIIQQDVLCELAKKLGLAREAQVWRERADALLCNLLERMWNGSEFVCIDAHGEAFRTDSLIRMMPVILGRRLPENILKALINELSQENHFLTGWGLATESVRSRLYDHRRGDPGKPNAYWRGPVWPPVIYLLVCGLKDAGETELAGTVAKRYLHTVESNPGAMYENYDALTGEGNDDPSYTWTSAVYLLLKDLMQVF